MRRLLVLLALAGLAAFPVALAGDDGGAPQGPPAQPPADASRATKPYASADGRFTLSLPAAWTVERADVDQAAMAWTVTVPNLAGTVRIAVFHLPGLVNARAQPYAERDVHPTRFGVPGPAHVELDPAPHLWLDMSREDGGARAVFLYRVIRRNGFTLRVYCAPQVWTEIRGELLRALASLSTTAVEWPPPPDAYRVVRREGTSYRLHPSVKDADVEAVHRRLRDLEADFAKVHGPVWRPAECPVVVYLHAKAADAAAVDAEAAAARSGILASHAKVALFVVPPAKGDDAAAADLAREAWELFLLQTFGRDVPYWIWCAEPELASAEVRTGKPLPSIPEGFVNTRRTLTRTLADLATAGSADGDTFDTMLAYYAFFRCGPKSYRDAFATFLKESAANGDCTTAQRDHLLSLDQEKLRAAVQAWLPKGLNPVKPR